MTKTNLQGPSKTTTFQFELNLQSIWVVDISRRYSVHLGPHLLNIIHEEDWVWSLLDPLLFAAKKSGGRNCVELNILWWTLFIAFSK